jgi:hypothetical protein
LWFLGCSFFGYHANGARHGIKPSLVEWVATTNTFHTKPTASDGAVYLYRLIRVVRARRVVPTILSQKRRDDLLIRSDRTKKCPSTKARLRIVLLVHHMSLSLAPPSQAIAEDNQFTSSLNGTASTSGEATTT